MILTTTQAASLRINSRDFRFPAYREEIRLVETMHARKVEGEMRKAGFHAEYLNSEHGYTIKTGRGGFPSFAPTGFISMEDARRIFAKS
jgi:hypothetical protein